jgi:phenylacetate-CoA ligase
VRIKGWMGRADQRTKVRGMFVDPAQVQAVRQAHAEIARLRLVVSRQDDKDVMLLRVATHASDDASPLATPATIADTLQRITGLAASVELSPDGLPNDGVVIEDQRDYEQ